jgi:hypothetical protein
MTDEHLMNTIAMIHRGCSSRGRFIGPRLTAKLPALQLEYDIRRFGLRNPQKPSRRKAKYIRSSK